MNNKQKNLLILGLVVIVLILIGVGLFFKKPVDKKITSNPCEGISETECFSKLSRCIEATLLSDYMYKKGFRMDLEGWPDAYTEEMKPPLPTNFPSAKIFLNKQPMGGGDYGSDVFIKLNNIYCDLTPETPTPGNIKTVFAPIKSKNDALNYYIFVSHDLASAMGRSRIYILKEEDYDGWAIKEFTTGCKDYKTIMQNKVTTIEETEDEYLITFIVFNNMIETAFFKSVVKIKTDGTIEEISRKTLLDCGEGGIF